MLDETLVTQILSLRGEEDNTLWRQGDLLRDNPLSAAETKKLAELAQLKASTLNLRRRVSTETPEDKRNPSYSWSIYRIFIRIEDPEVRWQLMFSRKEWTIQSATEAVSRVTSGKPIASQSVSKKMIVGDITVWGKLEKDGTLTVKVALGDNYDNEITSGGRFTTIEFTP